MRNHYLITIHRFAKKGTKSQNKLITPQQVKTLQNCGPKTYLNKLKMTTSQKYINRIGRTLFSLIFIASGLSKIGDWDKTISYMESHNMILTPIFLMIAILLQVIGGLSIITSYKTKIGTILLLTFMLAATFIFHDFWTLPTETELELITQQIEMVSFLKNITIIGALILIFNNEKE